MKPLFSSRPLVLSASLLLLFGVSPIKAQPPAAPITPPPGALITPPPAGFTPPPTVAPIPLPRERFQVFATNATKLKKFSDAVKVMKSRPVSDKTSWAYWANIHGVNGASNPDWNQCRHAQWWFVAWHRAYVLELEHQLQAAIHDPTFRLPYWDYLDAGQRKIPAAFKKTTSSLFESQRDGDEVGFETVDLQKTFSATKYLGSIGAGGFGGASVSSGTISGPFSKRGRMEQNPHNTVHVDIGGLMGDPATAAQDPIFWVHHCNIDRMWEVWIKNGPHTNPAGAFTTETFTLPGVDGQPVTHKVADMFDTKKLGYTYDRTNLQVQLPGSTPPPPPAPKKAPAPASSPAMSEAEPSANPSAPPSPAETEEPLQPRVLLATAPKDKPITVANQPQTIKVAPEVVPAEHNMLRRDVDHKKAKKKVFLSLEGITFTEPPKHLYKVYLNLPNADHKVAPNAPQYVGTLAFFESHDGHHGNEGGGDRTETFDITDSLAAAKKAGNYDPNNLTVTIVPVGPPKDGKRLPPQNAKEITVTNISIKTADQE